MSLAADYTNTPMYIQPFRPISRSNDISQSNTEWMKMLHRVDLIPHLQGKPKKEVQFDTEPPKQVPNPTMNTQNQVQVHPTTTAEPPTVVEARNPHVAPANYNPHSLPPPRFQQVPGSKLPLIQPAGQPPRPAPSTPFRPFRDDFRTDEYYRKYMQLSGNMAYKYPEPGYPRERQGAMGGTWRHIKEVNGYTGSQVCFVDGLVRLYDHDMKRQVSPSKQNPHMRATMATPAYAANRHNVSSYHKTLQYELERGQYKPWQSSNPPAQSAQLPPVSSAGKYKGFYSYGSQ